MWPWRPSLACFLAAILGACEGPPVGPPLVGEGAGGEAATDAWCEDYCGRTPGCDRDCVHACGVNRTLCPTEWDAAFDCAGDGARCDPDWGVPSTADGCEDDFARALACSPHGSCASEDSFELCHGCCAAFEREGGVAWQGIFRECACERCAVECGDSYCSADTGSAIECESCTASQCTEEVARNCRSNAACERYDVCVGGCPLDESSHCSEEESSNACEACCVGDFSAGAVRYDEVLSDCACNTCSAECLDSDICQGFDIIKPVCQRCLDSTCSDVLVETCGSEPACSSFMVCRSFCSP